MLKRFRTLYATGPFFNVIFVYVGIVARAIKLLSRSPGHITETETGNVNTM